SDIILPEGVVSVALSHGEESDLTVASVQMPRGGAEEEEAIAEGEGEGEEAETEEAPTDEGEEASSDDSGGDSDK
ncbi:MAG: hypothetical protein VB960_01785, partial [Pseudohongiellaceae bacterium]